MKNNTIYIIIASIAVVVVGAVAFVLVSTPQTLPTSQSYTQINSTVQSPIENLKKFNSTDELQKFLLYSQTKVSVQYYGGMGRGVLENQMKLAQPTAGIAAPVPSTPQGAQVS